MNRTRFLKLLGFGAIGAAILPKKEDELIEIPKGGLVTHEELKVIGKINGNDLKLIDTREIRIKQIARAYNVPDELLYDLPSITFTPRKISSQIKLSDELLNAKLL